MRFIQFVYMLLMVNALKPPDWNTYNISSEHPRSSFEMFKLRYLNRSKRANNDLDFFSFVEEMTKLSRVFAGISLEIGLMDNSIPADDAFSELMNLMDVNVGELEKFNRNDVDAFFSKLKSLNLDVSQELDDVSKTLQLVNHRVKSYSKIDNPKGMITLNQFYDDLELLSTGNVEFKPYGYDKQKYLFENLLRNIEYFKKLPPVVITKDEIKAVATLIDIKEGLETLENTVNRITAVWNTIKGLTVGDNLKQSACEFIALYSSFLSEIDRIELEEKSVNSLLNSFQSISSMNQSFESSNKDFSSLTNVISSVQNEYDTYQRNCTSGLSKGYSDLNGLPSLVKESFFKSSFGDLSWDKVEAGLRPMDSIAGKTELLSVQWKPLKDLPVKTKLSGVLANFKSLKQVTASSQIIIDLISPIVDLKNLRSSSIVEKSKKSCDEINSLNEKLTHVISVISKIAESELFVKHNRISNLKSLINFTGDSTQQIKDLNDVLKNMRTFQELDILITTLKEQESHQKKLDAELKGFEFATAVKNILTNRTVIEALMKDGDTDRLIQCLDGSKESSETLQTISNAVTLTKKMNDVKRDAAFLGAISLATNTIEKSLPAVKDLRSEFLSIKNDQKPEMREFLKLKALVRESKIFGDAVEGLVHLKKVMEAEGKLDKLLEEGRHIDNEIIKLKKSQIKDDIIRDWGKFAELEASVLQLKLMLDGKRKLFKKNKSKRSIYQFHSYFKKMTGLVDFNLGLTQKLKAVTELLKAENAKTTESVKESLTSLEQLDLQFAKYNGILSTVPTTLQSIQSMFEDFLKVMQVSLTPPMTPIPSPSIPTLRPVLPNQQSPQSTRNIPLGTADGPSSTVGNIQTEITVWWQIVLAVLSGALLGGCIVGGSLFACKNRKDERKKEKELENKPIVDIKVSKESGHHEERIKELEERLKNDKVEINDLNSRNYDILKELKKNQTFVKGARDTIFSMDIRTQQYLVMIFIKGVRKPSQKLWGFPEETSINEALVKGCSKYDVKLRIAGFRPDIIAVDLSILQSFIEKSRYFAPTKEFEKMNQSSTLIKTFYQMRLDFVLDWTDIFLMRENQKDQNMTHFRNRNVYCWELTRVRVPQEGGEEVVISANEFLFPVGRGIITQLPMSIDKENIAFWSMIYKEQSSYIVFFNHDGNTVFNYPRTLAKPVKNYGSYKIKLTKIYKLYGCTFRKLTVSKSTNKNFNIYITHIEANILLGDDIPKTEEFRHNFKKLYKLSRECVPLVVYDKDGSFKAGLLLAVEYVVQSVCVLGHLAPNMEEQLIMILQMRGHIFTKPEQIMFVENMAIEILYEKIGGEMPASVFDSWTAFSKMEDKEYDDELRENVKNSDVKTSDNTKSEKSTFGMSIMGRKSQGSTVSTKEKSKTKTSEKNVIGKQGKTKSAKNQRK